MLQIATTNLPTLVGPFNGSSLGGNAAVQELQKALIALAQAASWPAANPGVADGVMGAKTIGALAAAIGGILDNTDLGGSEKTLIRGALAIALTNDSAMGQAKQYAAQYASYLTMGVRALTLKYMGQGTPPVPTPAPAGQGAKSPLSTAQRSALLQKLVVTRTLVPFKKYPAGTIATKSGAVWRVAVPAGTKGFGSPDMELAGTHKEVATVPTLPAGVTSVTTTDFTKATGPTPWYKNWKTYAIVGGVLAAGTGAYVFLR